MRAALLESANSALALVDDLDVAEPGVGLVRVRVHHCGLCHSDLTIIESTAPAQLPVVLGHEAAGVVEAVGPGVQSVEARRSRGAGRVGAVRPVLLVRAR